MNRVSELKEMVDRLGVYPDAGMVSVSAQFLRELYDEVRDDEMLTPKVLARILMRTYGVAGELATLVETAQSTLPQVAECIEKLSGRAAAAERESIRLRHDLAVMERAAGLAKAAEAEEATKETP